MHRPAAIGPAFLTTLKPPGGAWWTAQVNALQQLQALAPGAPRLVFGGGEAVAALCDRYGAQHRWPGDLQLPRLDALLAEARRACPGASQLIYLNVDILLLPSFLMVLAEVASAHAMFLLTARRCNISPTGDLSHLDGAPRQNHLQRLAHHGGSLGGIGALDVFAFPTGAFAEVPPLVIGRAGWDNWLVGEARRCGLPVINASGAAGLLHQNHGYEHLPDGERSIVGDALARSNQDFLTTVVPGNVRSATHWWPRCRDPSRPLLATTSAAGPPAAAWYSWCLPAGTEVNAERLAWLAAELEPLAGSADLVLLGSGSRRFAHLAPGDYGLNGLHPWLLPLLWDGLPPGAVVVNSALLDGLLPSPPLDQAGPWPAAALWLDRLLQLAARGAWFATLPDQPPAPSPAPLPQAQRAYWEVQLLRRPAAIRSCRRRRSWRPCSPAPGSTAPAMPWPPGAPPGPIRRCCGGSGAGDRRCREAPRPWAMRCPASTPLAVNHPGSMAPWLTTGALRCARCQLSRLALQLRRRVPGIQEPPDSTYAELSVDHGS